MIKNTNFPPIPLDKNTTYLNCLLAHYPNLNPQVKGQVLSIVQKTNWDEPQSGHDFNNIGVIALVEADTASDLSTRELYLEIAHSAFEQGRAEYPLCDLHSALIYCLVGEVHRAIQIAFSCLMNLLQSGFKFEPSEILPGLIFLPLTSHPPQSSQAQILEQLLGASGYSQCLFLVSEVMLHSQMVFYNAFGLRLLHLAVQLSPHNTGLNLRLGISSLLNNQREGFLYLHRAAEAAPTDFFVCQSLSVAYRDWGQANLADFWLQQAQQSSTALQQGLTSDLLHAYVPFDEMLIVVQPSFRSIVTAVLLAEADWFEQEMEFWRNQIQADMVVIDVGANVGIYTLSAARRVGYTGRVIAVEPFSECVNHLQESCRLNQLAQVKVIRAAASDHDGEIYLALSAASELNQVVKKIDNTQGGQFEVVPCLTLDGLSKSERLSRVDLLKIDAEGHELEVLMGSEMLLKQFSPIILYENIADSQGSNLEVAEYLQSNGYQLFRYQPYLQNLIPVNTGSEFQNSLNLIAMRPH